MAILPVGAEVTRFVPGMGATPSVSNIGDIAGIGGIGGIGAIGDGGVGAVNGTSFSDLLTKGIQNVQATQDKASTLSGKVATGELTDIHEFTTAAAKANLAVSLTSATRNRAIEAYQEIMRMQL